MTDELLFAPIAELQRFYARREVSPVEILDATLARLDLLEPRLNAFVTVLEQSARAQARDSEATFASGEPRPPR